MHVDPVPCLTYEKYASISFRSAPAPPPPPPHFSPTHHPPPRIRYDSHPTKRGKRLISCLDIPEIVTLCQTSLWVKNGSPPPPPPPSTSSSSSSCQGLGSVRTLQVLQWCAFNWWSRSVPRATEEIRQLLSNVNYYTWFWRSRGRGPGAGTGCRLWRLGLVDCGRTRVKGLKKWPWGGGSVQRTSHLGNFVGATLSAAHFDRRYKDKVRVHRQEQTSRV